MRKHGFRPYPNEWWHFTLRNEPFPKTYFDFPVNSQLTKFLFKTSLSKQVLTLCLDKQKISALYLLRFI